MGLDWGEKRVGIAISDPLGISAQGLATMSRRNKQKDFNYLGSLVRKNQVCLIVLGLPINMDGTEGYQAQRVREVAGEIEKIIAVPVQLWDERLTSSQAHRVLEQAGIAHSRQGGSVDRIAAALLLQSYLDSQARPATVRGDDDVDNGIEYRVQDNRHADDMRHRLQGGSSDEEGGESSAESAAAEDLP